VEYHDCYNHDLVQREQRNLGLNTFTLSCLMLIVGTYFLLVSIFGNFLLLQLVVVSYTLTMKIKRLSYQYIFETTCFLINGTVGYDLKSTICYYIGMFSWSKDYQNFHFYLGLIFISRRCPIRTSVGPQSFDLGSDWLAGFPPSFSKIRWSFLVLAGLGADLWRGGALGVVGGGGIAEFSFVR
jgi:hypothetical protein